MSSQCLKENNCNTPKASIKKWHGMNRLLPWAVMFFSLAITYHLWQIERDANVLRLQQDFDFQVHENSSDITDRLRTYEQVLRGVQGLFAATANVRRDDFRNYVNHQRLEEDYPGIQGVGFALIVSPEQKESHIAAIRKEMSGKSYPIYTIRPEGQRNFYTSILYLEPFSSRNLRAFGYDMYSEPVRRLAMERARDSGNVSISGKVRLVQETGKNEQAGFLMYLPIYRNGAPHSTVIERRANIIGWAYEAFRMEDFINGIREDRANELDYEIFDGDEISASTLMYDSDHLIDSTRNSRLQTSTGIDIAGHHWRMQVGSYPSFENRLDMHRTTLILQGGITVSLLMTLLTWLLVTGRARALALAQTMTRELAQNEQILKQENEKNIALLHNASDGIHILDTKGNIIEVSDSFCAMLGYRRDEMMGMNVSQWDAKMTAPELTQALSQQFSQKKRSLFQTLHRRKDGTVFNVEISGSPLELGGRLVLFNSSRDITERKQLEEAREEALSRLEKIANQVPGVVYQYRLRADGSSYFPFASAAIREIYRVSPEEVREDAAKVFSIIHPDDLEAVGASIHKSAQDLTLWRHEYRVKFNDGTVRWLLGNAMPQRESDGAVLWHGFITDITDRKQAEAIFRGLFDQSSFLAGILDQQGRLIDVNSTAMKFTSAAREDVINQYFPDTPWWSSSADRSKLNKALNLAYKGVPASFERMQEMPSGGHIDMIFSAMPINTDNGTYLSVIGVDITERKRAEEALRDSERRFHFMLESSPIAVRIADVETGRVVFANQSYCELIGSPPDKVLGVDPRQYYANPQDYDDVIENIGKGQNVTNKMVKLLVGESHKKTKWALASYRLLEFQYKSGVLGWFYDITEHKQADEKIFNLAFYDTLTQLPNRRLLNDRLSQAMAVSRRSGSYSALIFLDLDNFKPLNDKHGHAVGDLLLIEVGVRLKNCVREMDTVARFGGDEFVVVLSELNPSKAESISQAKIVAEKIQVALSKPYLLTIKQQEHAGITIEHRCTASIGVVVFLNHEVTQNDLLKWADSAMYAAKEAGRNLIQFYDAGV